MLSCTQEHFPKEADISVATGNLLYTNSEDKIEVTKAFLKLEADIIIFNEADPGKNIDSALLESNGYYTQFIEASIVPYNILIAYKMSGFSGEVAYSITETEEPIYAPYATLNVTVKGRSVSVIGAHIPAPFYFSEDERDAAYKVLYNMIEDGKIKTSQGSAIAGDLSIIAGDYNTFSSDERLFKLFDLGMIDSFIANPYRYSYTWGPDYLPPVARIDYILVSKEMSPVYQETFAIPGSDHQGILAGINIL